MDFVTIAVCEKREKEKKKESFSHENDSVVWNELSVGFEE